VNWTLNFRDAGNNIVRTTTGQGGSFSYAWDGKDSGAVVQADGGYSVELLINDGNMNGSSTKSVTIDKTFPVSQISYPNGGGVLSNVYQAGSMNVTVTGNNSDLNFLNWSLDYGSGASPSSWTALGNGTLPVSGSIVTWNTSALTNGTYTLRLQTWDLAGNRSPSLATLTVGNFKVSQSYQEMPFGGTQSYTSNVPFPLTETIVIKDSAGNIVRNLVSGVSRNAGTYIDAWNGRTNSNAYLPDGGYLYEATVTDGTNSLNWNLTKAFFPTYESYDTFPNWNPFNNNPLVITMPYNYSPAQYVWVFAPPGNFWQGPDATVYGLIYGGCQPPNFCPVDHKYIESGTMVFDWAGVDAIGAFRSDIKAYALAWDELSPNAVVIYGTRPKFTQRASISPALFYPVKGPQTVSYTFTSYQNQPVNVTATFLNQSSLSTLRTMNLANVTPGAKTISWDGKADNGMWVAPGYYTITVKITDSIGNVATSQILTTVRY
jgi:flagellar hook assembly protein FlgD